VREVQLETRLLASRIDHTLADGSGSTGRGGRPAGMGGRVPVALDADSDDGRSPAPELSPAPDGDRILDLQACPVCRGDQWTGVCEYNKFLLLDHAPDRDASVYHYAMCHACGITFARRRPTGCRYTRLLERFDETIGRAGRPGRGPDGAALNPTQLTAEDRAELIARAAHGVFVSEHLGRDEAQYLPALLRDRLGNSLHIEILTSLLSFRAPRVLELRPRVGSIGAALKRVWNAEVFGLPLFESQQLLNREVYGHTVDHLLDYDHFAIPYAGAFDLVIANHMMTHAVRPREFLDLVRARLAPGGHLYLYNEPDDAEFLNHGQSMINTLNPFHLQAFDRDSLLRGLAAAGWETVFAAHERGNVVAVARPVEGAPAMAPMSDDQRCRRLARYQQARDLAIVRVPSHVRPRFAGEWEQIVERVFTAGLAEMTPGGKIRVVNAAEPVPEDLHA
jgi:SAM-dependent methyltransferase